MPLPTIPLFRRKCTRITHALYMEKDRTGVDFRAPHAANSPKIWRNPPFIDGKIDLREAQKINSKAPPPFPLTVIGKMARNPRFRHGPKGSEGSYAPAGARGNRRLFEKITTWASSSATTPRPFGRRSPDESRRRVRHVAVAQCFRHPRVP